MNLIQRQFWQWTEWFCGFVLTLWLRWGLQSFSGCYVSLYLFVGAVWSCNFLSQVSGGTSSRHQRWLQKDLWFSCRAPAALQSMPASFTGLLQFWYVSLWSQLKHGKWQNHSTSAPTDSLLMEVTLCCCVCIFWKVLVACCRPPPSWFSVSSLCSAPAELKLWILSAFQTVPLRCHADTNSCSRPSFSPPHPGRIREGKVSHRPFSASTEMSGPLRWQWCDEQTERRIQGDGGIWKRKEAER